MQAALGLAYRIFTMSFPWNIWVMLMGLVNVAGGLYFVRTFEGVFALAAMAGAFMVMTAVYARLGFVRLLGIGHIVFWPPLVAWFLWVIFTSPTSATLRGWLVAVIIVNSISLIIDVFDVLRYARGERKPLDSPRTALPRPD